LFRDEHRERRLAGADVAHDPQPAPRVEVGLDPAHVAAHHLDLVRRAAREIAHRRALEGDAAVAARDAPHEAARAGGGDAPRTALAVGGGVGLLVDDEAAAVTDAERASRLAGALAGASLREA